MYVLKQTNKYSSNKKEERIKQTPTVYSDIAIVTQTSVIISAIEATKIPLNKLQIIKQIRNPIKHNISFVGIREVLSQLASQETHIHLSTCEYPIFVHALFLNNMHIPYNFVFASLHQTWHVTRTSEKFPKQFGYRCARYKYVLSEKELIELIK